MKNISTIAASLLFLGVFLSACSTPSLQRNDFSPAQLQALEQISGMISDSCRADGLMPGTDAFRECYWKSASRVRSALLEKQERELLADGSHPLFAYDRTGQAFENRDRRDDQVAFDNAYVERAQADEARGHRR